MYTSYTVASTGLSLGTGHRFSRYVNGYVGYNYSKNQYSNFDVNSTLTLDPRYYTNYDKSSVIVSATFDNTDDYYIPREGMNFSQSFEKAGLGGSSDFWKSRSTFGAYKGLQKLTDMDLIVRYKARFNYAKETGYLPIAEKFYMGGIGSVRGFRSYSISPVGNPAYINGVLQRIGGSQTFSNSFELSVPLVPEAKMRATAFVDYGWIGDSSLTEIARGGYGIGLEWFSPVGPLQLVFANPIGTKPDDNIAHFEFTIGQRF
jgi:outer membrane protein insertion porin family